MDKALADLIRISNTTGRDSALVQGGGGNTSVKTADGKYMYIKASGTALKDMNAKQGWRRLRLDAVLSVIEDKSLAKLDASQREPAVVDRLLLACDDKVRSAARPSVESHLHAFLERCVIHLHPIVVAAYVNAKNGRAQIDKLFKSEKFQLVWVPYTDPGFMLAKRISKLVKKYQQQHGRKPAVMILEKHGLFVTAQTPDAALRLVRKVIKLCSSKLKAPKECTPSPKTAALRLRSGQALRLPPGEIAAAKAAIGKAVLDATGQSVSVTYYSNKSVAAFMARKDAAELLATPALNPDELVYASGSAMWLENYDAKTITRKLKSLVRRGQKPAAAFVVKGLGLFVAADEKAAPLIAEITTSSLVIRMHAAKFGGVLALNKRQQDFINNWESEAFRKKLVSKKK
ncbi:MAG TPA: class II aldolase/adducin family protein [Sedimentisphaerales bacterium]|nr:class II aldolase/adducin family protein [Sedimentisphaerales bacterium]